MFAVRRRRWAGAPGLIGYKAKSSQPSGIGLKMHSLETMFA
jgi:hypothetical protein